MVVSHVPEPRLAAASSISEDISSSAPATKVKA